MIKIFCDCCGKRISSSETRLNLTCVIPLKKSKISFNIQLGTGDAFGMGDLCFNCARNAIEIMADSIRDDGMDTFTKMDMMYYETNNNSR